MNLLFARNDGFELAGVVFVRPRFHVYQTTRQYSINDL